MAVLKSTAYGQVRKSVGANNYYRRAGVQIVRSKPTFAPGRTFTPAQLTQQDYMKIAQYGMSTIGFGGVSDTANVYNKKMYNASSRFNRGVQGFLKGMKGIQFDISRPLYWAFAENWEQICNGFSVGDVKGYYDLTTVSYANDIFTITVNNAAEIVNRLIYLVNKRRASSGMLSWKNIGIAGVLLFNDMDAISFQQIPAVFAKSYSDDATGVLTFDVPRTTTYVEGSTAYICTWLFVSEIPLTGAHGNVLSALHCTDSYAAETNIGSVSSGNENPDVL